jgi:hypothetical protein
MIAGPVYRSGESKEFDGFFTIRDLFIRINLMKSLT